MSPLLKVGDICVRFRDNPVLDHVGFQIEKGQIVTLIGPNGAGKTTLVKVILGLLPANRGSVELAPGTTIGYMPQKLTVDATMPLSARRFLQLANRSPEAARQALARVDIAHLADRPVHGLSGGETQRLLLARALLRKPDLLVLDEPVQGVDVNGQEALYQLIARIRTELGCGVLMVSHDLHLVMAATDLVICLNQHVCCSGSPEHVSSDPAFTELFGARTALYTHDHDHQHNLHGDVVEAEKAGKGGHA